ncbi:PR14L protein, partial [Polypterus senegalus]
MSTPAVSNIGCSIYPDLEGGTVSLLPDKSVLSPSNLEPDYLEKSEGLPQDSSFSVETCTLSPQSAVTAAVTFCQQPASLTEPFCNVAEETALEIMHVDLNWKGERSPTSLLLPDDMEASSRGSSIRSNLEYGNGDSESPTTPCHLAEQTTEPENSEAKQHMTSKDVEKMCLRDSITDIGMEPQLSQLESVLDVNNTQFSLIEEKGLEAPVDLELKSVSVPSNDSVKNCSCKAVSSCSNTLICGPCSSNFANDGTSQTPENLTVKNESTQSFSSNEILEEIKTITDPTDAPKTGNEMSSDLVNCCVSLCPGEAAVQLSTDSLHPTIIEPSPDVKSFQADTLSSTYGQTSADDSCSAVVKDAVDSDNSDLSGQVCLHSNQVHQDQDFSFPLIQHAGILCGEVPGSSNLPFNSNLAAETERLDLSAPLSSDGSTAQEVESSSERLDLKDAESLRLDHTYCLQCNLNIRVPSDTSVPVGLSGTFCPLQSDQHGRPLEPALPSGEHSMVCSASTFESSRQMDEEEMTTFSCAADNLSKLQEESTDLALPGPSLLSEEVIFEEMCEVPLESCQEVVYLEEGNLLNSTQLSCQADGTPFQQPTEMETCFTCESEFSDESSDGLAVDNLGSAEMEEQEMLEVLIQNEMNEDVCVVISEDGELYKELLSFCKETPHQDTSVKEEVDQFTLDCDPSQDLQYSQEMDQELLPSFDTASLFEHSSDTSRKVESILEHKLPFQHEHPDGSVNSEEEICQTFADSECDRLVMPVQNACSLEEPIILSPTMEKSSASTEDKMDIVLGDKGYVGSVNCSMEQLTVSGVAFEHLKMGVEEVEKHTVVEENHQSSEVCSVSCSEREAALRGAELVQDLVFSDGICQAVPDDASSSNSVVPSRESVQQHSGCLERSAAFLESVSETPASGHNLSDDPRLAEATLCESGTALPQTFPDTHLKLPCKMDCGSMPKYCPSVFDPLQNARFFSPLKHPKLLPPSTGDVKHKQTRGQIRKKCPVELRVQPKRRCKAGMQAVDPLKDLQRLNNVKTAGFTRGPFENLPQLYPSKTKSTFKARTVFNAKPSMSLEQTVSSFQNTGSISQLTCLTVFSKQRCRTLKEPLLMRLSKVASSLVPVDGPKHVARLCRWSSKAAPYKGVRSLNCRAADLLPCSSKELQQYWDNQFCQVTPFLRRSSRSLKMRHSLVSNTSDFSQMSLSKPGLWKPAGAFTTPVFPFSLHFKVECLSSLLSFEAVPLQEKSLMLKDGTSRSPSLSSSSEWTISVLIPDINAVFCSGDVPASKRTLSPVSFTYVESSEVEKEKLSCVIPTRTQWTSNSPFSRFGLHTILALFSPACYRIWTRQRCVGSQQLALQKHSFPRFEERTRAFAPRAHSHQSPVLPLRSALARIIAAWSSRPLRSSPAESSIVISLDPDYSYASLSPEMFGAKMQREVLPAKCGFTSLVQNVDSTYQSESCLTQLLPLPDPLATSIFALPGKTDKLTLPSALPATSNLPFLCIECSTTDPQDCISAVFPTPVAVSDLESCACEQQEEERPLDKTLGNQGGQKTRVSQIRIRRAIPKPDNSLTPMGLPKPKRLKKKEFSLEEIYTNKNYKSPPSNRSLETIFEEPKEKNGILVCIGQQKRKRVLDFQDFTVPRKRRNRAGVKLKMNRTRGRKASSQGDAELDLLLIEKLGELEHYLAKEGVEI